MRRVMVSQVQNVTKGKDNRNKNNDCIGTFKNKTGDYYLKSGEINVSENTQKMVLYHILNLINIVNGMKKKLKEKKKKQD